MEKPPPLTVTAGELYRPALEISDPEEARAYFERLVERRMRSDGCDRARAEMVERENLGYLAGFCADDVTRRVRSLFTPAHSVYGGPRYGDGPRGFELFLAERADHRRGSAPQKP